jgi:hypothetical protein
MATVKKDVAKNYKNIFFSEISSIFDKIVRIWIILTDPDPRGQ